MEPNPQQQSQCDELLPYVPAYSLGIADKEHKDAIDNALDDCPSLQAALKEYAGVNEMLAEGVPQVEPPARALDNLMSRVAPDERPSLELIEPERETRTRRTTLPWIIGLAALLIVSNVLWFLQASGMQGEIDLLTRLNQREQLPDDLQWVTFQGASEEEQPSVVMVWDVETGTATLYTDSLPPLQQDQSYQLWLLTGDERQSAGVFEPNATGRGTLRFQLPEPIESFSALGITAEPRGGSPQPTSDPVALVALS